MGDLNNLLQIIRNKRNGLLIWKLLSQGTRDWVLS